MTSKTDGQRERYARRRHLVRDAKELMLRNTTFSLRAAELQLELRRLELRELEDPGLVEKLAAAAPRARR